MGNRRGTESTLTESLRAIAADDAASGASAFVQMRLLQEVRRLRRARRRTLVKMSVLTAALSVATAIPLWHLATPDTREPSLGAQRPSPLPDGEVVTVFFPLVYSTVPISGARLVRLEVPRETVTALGLDTDVSMLGTSSPVVMADVVVGDDGLARAVRFVRPIRRNLEKEQQR